MEDRRQLQMEEKVERLIKDKDEEGLRELIAGGWDVNQQFHRFKTAEGCFGSVDLRDTFYALHVAVKVEWLQGVNLLLEHGAQTEKWDYIDSLRRFSSRTPLILAARYQELDIVERLVEAGAQVNAADSQTGETALYYAVAASNSACVQLLLKHGAHTDMSCHSKFGHPSPLVRCLFNCVGNHLKCHSEEERSASIQNATRTFHMLVRAGCDVNMSSAHHPSPLTAFCSAMGPDENSSEIVEALLKAGANMNSSVPSNVDEIPKQWVQSNTVYSIVPLGHTIKSKNLAALKLLVKFGCDPNRIYDERFIQEKTPPCALEYALEFNPDALATLLQAGSKLSGTSCNTLHMRKDWVSEMPDYLLHWVSEPRPLQWLCRTFLRETIKLRSPDKIDLLPLPRSLKEYAQCLNI